MAAEHRILQTMGKHMERRLSNTQPELGTVISGTPLVIQLDFDPNIQLHFVDHDLVVNDQLVLATGDRVVLEEMKGRGHVYAVHYRIGGKVGESVTGAGTAPVARLGDAIVTSGGANTNGHTHTGLITTGSPKVKVE